MTVAGVVSSDQLADHRLLSGRLNAVHRRTHADPVRQLVTHSSLHVCHESIGAERPDEESGIGDGIANPQVYEWSDCAEAPIESVAPIVGHMSGAEARCLVSGRRRNGHKRTVV